MTGRKINAYLELCKIKIASFSVLSAVSGFLSASSKIESNILFLLSGVFMLAGGAAALNQFQERDFDKRMERTQNRPIPSGKLGPLHALYFSLSLIAAGFSALLMTGSIFAALLGLLAIFWYNGVYTFLKRKTAFAVIPGALVGAIPPLIGWVSGGGALRDPRLLALCFFFFMWQVPHFWILLLNYGGEYKEAGFPSLSDIFSVPQLTRLTSHWTFATVVSCLLISFYGLVRSSLMVILLFALSLWLSIQGIKLMREGKLPGRNACIFFRRINFYMLSVIIFMSFDRMTYALTEHGLRAFIE